MTDDIKIEEAEKIELRVHDDTTVVLNLPEQYEIQELIGEAEKN